MMEQLDAAEKEASEVLHSLLSVEKIEKHSLPTEEQQQVVVVTTEPDILPDQGQDQGTVQWHHGQVMFANMVGGNTGLQGGEQVIWQLNHTPLTTQQHGTICIPAMHPLAQPLAEEQYAVQTTTEEPDPVTFTTEEVKGKPQQSKAQKTSGPKKKKKQQPPQQQQQQQQQQEQHDNKSHVRAAPLTLLEENAQQVRERFERGCECQEENCFKGLSPEYVYRHRLNIAELTKGEHDMYLMGVTMAVLTNPDETVRHKERRRLRAQYVFQGRRVCLDAFLYLENCTHYQLKRIRKHVMTHGVAPRVHGNHGKKPHNTFPLASYRHAASFLRQFIENHSPGSNAAPLKCKTKSGTGTNNKTAPIYLPSEITRKTIHNAYREHCEQFEPSIKVMGYSTFRQYMKEQFPHVKFCKLDNGVGKMSNSNASHSGNSSNNNNNNNNNSNLMNASNGNASPPQNSNNQQQSQPLTMEVEINPATMGMEVEIVPQQQPQQNQKLTDEGLLAQTVEHHETAPILTTNGDTVRQVTTIPIVLSQAGSQGNVGVLGTRQAQQAQGQQPQPQTTYIVTPVSQILNQAGGNNAAAYTSYQLTPAPPPPTPSGYATAGTITVANSQPGTYAFTTL